MLAAFLIIVGGLEILILLVEITDELEDEDPCFHHG